MKVIIWLFCAFIYGFIITTFSYVGISLGGLPTILLGGLLIFIAKSMCKNFDAQKKTGEADQVTVQFLSPATENPLIDFPAASEVRVSPSHAVSSPIKHAPNKQRFCRLCGNPIDHETKKCTHCGKQYFRNPLRSIPISTIVFFCFLCISSAVFISQINNKQEEIAVLNSTISELQSTIDLRERTINEYRSQIDAKNKRSQELVAEVKELREKSYYVDRNIAFIREDGTRKYHFYNCLIYKYSDSPISIYSISSAMNKGYLPCPHCRVR